MLVNMCAKREHQGWSAHRDETLEESRLRLARLCGKRVALEEAQRADEQALKVPALEELLRGQAAVRVPRQQAGEDLLHVLRQLAPLRRDEVVREPFFEVGAQVLQRVAVREGRAGVRVN